jgi:hypothetical protein
VTALLRPTVIVEVSLKTIWALPYGLVSMRSRRCTPRPTDSERFAAPGGVPCAL